MACAAVESLHQGECITSETRLFYGAPGAGKTSLLHEFEKRARCGELGTPKPYVINVHHARLNSEKDLIIEIAQHLDKAEVFRTIEQEQVGMGMNILNILKGSIQTSQILNPPEVTFSHLKALYNAAQHQPPILLCVDEIHNIKPAADEMLGLLHQGNHGLPIIPIYAGLGNSLNMLMSHGVSRPVSSYVHSVGALAKDDAQKCVSTMLKAFDVDCTNVDDDWPAILAECSDRWPQHLHNGMRALAKDLTRPDVNGVLRNVSLTNVSNIERAFRNEAYSWRISETIDKTKHLVAKVMQQVTAHPCGIDEVESIVLALDQQAPHDPALRSASLPEEMNASEYVNHMIHRGLLQKFTTGEINSVVTCPTPSFATYVMQRGGIDPEPQEDLQPSDLPEPIPFEDADPYKIPWAVSLSFPKVIRNFRVRAVRKPLQTPRLPGKRHFRRGRSSRTLCPHRQPPEMTGRLQKPLQLATY